MLRTKQNKWHSSLHYHRIAYDILDQTTLFYISVNICIWIQLKIIFVIDKKSI